MWNARLYFSTSFFDFYAENIKQYARLDDAQAEIKIAKRNFNSFRYANNTTYMAEGEKEPKNLLMKVKEESESCLKTQHSKSEDHAIDPVSFSSAAQSCLTLCDPMGCSTPGLPVNHQLPEFTQTHVYWVHDAIQPSHPLLSLLL